MKIKFDDGEHATTIDGEAIGNVVPEVGDTIEWNSNSDPEEEDDLARGRYRVTATEWIIDTVKPRGNMVTLHLEVVP